MPTFTNQALNNHFKTVCGPSMNRIFRDRSPEALAAAIALRDQKRKERRKRKINRFLGIENED